MKSFWLYESDHNIAFQQDSDLNGDEFSTSSEDNFFMIEEVITGQPIITATDGEFLSLRDVTNKQLVILFAELRNLKEEPVSNDFPGMCRLITL